VGDGLGVWGKSGTFVASCRGFVNVLKIVKVIREAERFKEFNEVKDFKEFKEMGGRLIRPVGNYNRLICYQKAECLYDITYYFTEKFLPRGDRTVGQMQQAARSGKQNISEGYTRAATSMDTALKLTDVAKSSLIELHDDYRDYLRVRGCRQWEDGSKEIVAMKRLARKHNNSRFYMELIATRPPETIANIAISLQKQTDYLLAKLLTSLEEDFLTEGGFREKMTRMRIEKRKGK